MISKGLYTISASLEGPKKPKRNRWSWNRWFQQTWATLGTQPFWWLLGSKLDIFWFNFWLTGGISAVSCSPGCCKSSWRSSCPKSLVRCGAHLKNIWHQLNMTGISFKKWFSSTQFKEKVKWKQYNMIQHRSLTALTPFALHRNLWWLQAGPPFLNSLFAACEDSGLYPLGVALYVSRRFFSFSIKVHFEKNEHLGLFQLLHAHLRGHLSVSDQNTKNVGSETSQCWDCLFSEFRAWVSILVATLGCSVRRESFSCAKDVTGCRDMPDLQC